MFNHILYLHGYNSSSSSRTAQELKRVMTPLGYEVYAINLPKEPLKALALIKSTIKSKQIGLLVGSSLGGFYALQFKNVPKLVMNPCLKPSQELPKLDSFISPNIIKQFEDIEANQFKNIDAEVRSCTFAIFGKNDKLFNYSKLYSQYYHNVAWTGDEHRISPQTVATIIPERIQSIKDAWVKLGYALGADLNESKTHLLLERFITTIDRADRALYVKEVYEILKRTYSRIGGLYGIDGPEDLLNDSDMFKLVRKGGKIVAAFVYTFKRGGRKMIYAGQDGTPTGKAAFHSVMQEDAKLRDRQAWTEVSGAAEKASIKDGMTPLPAQMVVKLMPDKEIVSFDSDGFHYTRNINGHYVTKMLFGNIVI